MKPFRLTPSDIAIASLLEHQRYYREEKIPALEVLFDVLKEGLAASGGNAESWILSEYTEVHRQVEEAQHVIREIETRIQDLGQTVEGLDDLENRIEYGDPT